ADIFLRCVLENTAVRDWSFERWLTEMRASLLAQALNETAKASGDVVAFATALARQCYINEYVFAVSDGEGESIATLKSRVVESLGAGTAVTPRALAMLASYGPLHALACADRLLSRKWL